MAILGQSAKLNVRQSMFCCLIAKLNVRHILSQPYMSNILSKSVQVIILQAILLCI